MAKRNVPAGAIRSSLPWPAESATVVGGEDAGEVVAGVAAGAAAEVRPQPESPAEQTSDAANAVAAASGLQGVRVSGNMICERWQSLRPASAGRSLPGVSGRAL